MSFWAKRKMENINGTGAFFCLTLRNVSVFILFPESENVCYYTDLQNYSLESQTNAEL